LRVRKSLGPATTTAAGTTNTIPKYTAATVLGNSSITDNGTNVYTSENVLFTGSVGVPNGSLGIGTDGTGDLYLNSVTGKKIGLNINGVQSSYVTNVLAGFNVPIYLFSNLIGFNAIATAGLGVPAIYTAYASGSQNAALTAVGSYTPPATAGRYRVTANVYCTVGTTTTFSVKVNYYDLNGTGHADILPLVSAAAPGVFLLNGLVIAAGTYYAMPIEIDIDNSQTPITFSTVGTFTTVTYFLNATLEQLS